MEKQQDAQAMFYNYFYNGWLYRIETEGVDAVQEDSNKAAGLFMEKLKEEIRKELLEEQKAERREKYYATKEAVQPS